MTTQKNPKKKNKSGKLKKAGSIIKGSSQVVQGIGSILEAVGGNHPAWYNAYPLDKLVALNFGQREKLGFTIPLNGGYTRSPSDVIIPIELTIPASHTGKDALTESMQILMNKLRAATGSNVTYTINDLTRYVLNAREIIALYSVIRRTILASRIVDVYDEDAPKKYMLGSINYTGSYEATVSTATVTSNLANDVVRLNRLSMVISSLIPINMNILARTSWLFSNIFADSPTSKFSTKMFTLADYGHWTESAGVISRTSARTVWNMQPHPLSVRLDDLEAMISAFSADVQNSRIAGDLLKAFGSYFVHLQAVDENTRILPLFDEAALTQIQNATFIGSTSTLTQSLSTSGPSVDVTINTGIFFSPTSFDSLAMQVKCTMGGYSAFSPDSLVNSYKDRVEPAELLSLTRLVTLFDIDEGTWTGDSATNVAGTVGVAACGTEIARNYIYISDLTPNGLGAWSITTTSVLSGFTSGWNSTGRGITPSFLSNIATFWSADDYAPRLPINCNVDTQIATKFSEINNVWDASNWASIDAERLTTYHQIAAMSLFATPDFIKEQSDFQFI